MFNMWNRTYVQSFNQRQIFDSKAILADSQWASVVFIDSMFNDGGSLVHQEWNIDDVVEKHYDKSYGNFLKCIMADRADKWAIVVTPLGYYKLLAHYLKEIQYTFKLSNEDMYAAAFSYMYNNFYYSGDQQFVEGFVDNSFRDVIRLVFDTYTPIGVFDDIDPDILPTELTYFLVSRKLIPESAVEPKLVNAAKLVLSRLWQVHRKDFSDWLVLDTPLFLNILKKPETPTVVESDFSLTDMFNFVKSDEYLNSMLFTSFPFFSSPESWDSDPNFKTTASRMVGAWEGIADYLIERGSDSSWLDLRHKHYTEVALRRDYIKSTCEALRYILKLDGAPDTLDKPILDMIGYDLLTECFNVKYNKTLLLLTFKTPAATFAGFIDDAFGLIGERNAVNSN